ncbi:ABC transporter ATP-binding protein [Streptacidiphilus rugosus]|uniref:ABC transporter ATP-binding protein n=1 Tax=Streptacidiphilus rugosus TaxID=405783 RepID=UPI0007C7415A|nr:ABC transporter ATP-binding protein [Streptacidiphilus rugosus]
MEHSTMPPLQARGISKSFTLHQRRIDAVREANLSLAAGEVTALVGRSGSGKTTLLQVIGLLTPPDAGEVLIAGNDAWSLSGDARADLRARTLGFVFQSFNLLPQHSAVLNVALPFRGPRRVGLQRAGQLLERVGLADRATHHPSQLSAGEQQRVALARALVNDPQALLADEPTGNLDAANEEQLLDLFRELAAEGRAVLLITHSDTVAARADRVFRMVDGAPTPVPSAAAPDADPILPVEQS